MTRATVLQEGRQSEPLLPIPVKQDAPHVD